MDAINVVLGAGGGITPAGNQGLVLVTSGDDASFIILPNSGYSIDSVIIDGTNNSAAVASGIYNFSAVSTNHSIRAVFKAVTYKVTYNGNDETGGTVPPPQTKKHGMALTLATNSGDLVKYGYTFDGWNTESNRSGTNYGVGKSYTENAPMTLYAKWVIKDIDGNKYTDVTIGDQVWMKENLKVTRLNDGRTVLSFATDATSWENLTKSELAGYCFYNDNESNKDKYGALYNWYAVNSGKLASEGWHVPTQDEMATLIKNVNYNSATITNKDGFNALFGGLRAARPVEYPDLDFGYLSILGNWWTKTEVGTTHAINMLVGSSNVDLERSPKGYGISVRLIRDAPP